jgi:hypothetical protein
MTNHQSNAYLIDTSVSGSALIVSISVSGRTAISIPGKDSMNGSFGYYTKYAVRETIVRGWILGKQPGLTDLSVRILENPNYIVARDFDNG